MKKYLKRASIYLLFLFLIAVLLFSINNFYGRKISQNTAVEIRQIAENNNYQVKALELKANPFLREISIQNLDLSSSKLNFNLKHLKINFSWQQLLSYIRYNNFQLDKNFKAELKEFNYSSLKNNYKLKLEDSQLNYQGNIDKEELAQIKEFSDLNIFLDDNHNLTLNAEKLKVDFPYYRSYGLDKEDWDRLSTFSDFIIKADYNKEEKKIDLKRFDLSNDILKIIFNLDSELVYLTNKEKLSFKNIKSNYDFLLAAEELEFRENKYYQNLDLKQFDFAGAFNLSKNGDNYKFDKLNYNFNLTDFNILFSRRLSNYFKNYSFGFLESEKNIGFSITNLKYEQQFSYPNGKSTGALNSSLVEAELNAEYNYNQKIPYINNALIKYKTKTEKAESINLFVQLILEKLFSRDDEGYYKVEVWGPLDNLNYK